jgi:hypothetical protein
VNLIFALEVDRSKQSLNPTQLVYHGDWVHGVRMEDRMD